LEIQLKPTGCSALVSDPEYYPEIYYITGLVMDLVRSDPGWLYVSE